MNLQFCESITGKQLDEFTRSSSCNNIYQTEGWAQVKKEWSAKYVGMRQDGELCGGSDDSVPQSADGHEISLYSPRPDHGLHQFRTDGIFLIVHSEVLRKTREP